MPGDAGATPCADTQKEEFERANLKDEVEEMPSNAACNPSTHNIKEVDPQSHNEVTVVVSDVATASVSVQHLKDMLHLSKDNKDPLAKNAKGSETEVSASTHTGK